MFGIFDIKNISSKDFKEYLESIENAELSDAFWDTALVQNLQTIVSSSPNFNVYFDELIEQCNGSGQKYGGMEDLQTLKENLTMNCIPDTTFSMDIDNYNEFLMQRRLLMAKKIKDCYYSL